MNLESLYKTLGPAKKRGIVCPLFYLRTENSSQIGEFPDLVILGTFARSTGFNLLQLLPIFDTGTEASPYSARSCYALNPIYLSIKNLSGIDPTDPDFIKLYTPSDSLHFDYEELYNLKMQILRRYVFAQKDSLILHPDFLEFEARNPWLKPYAAFCAHREDTDLFPEYWLTDLETIVAKKSDEVFFYSILQYFCAQQLTAAKKALTDMGLHLMGDIPILLNSDSAELWTHQDLFDPILTVGAPPDPLAPEGQSWGFPMIRFVAKPQACANFWRSRIDHLSQYFSLYRIDHAIGFFRFWVIPRGKKSTEGFFFPASDEIAMNTAKTLFELIFKNSPMIPIAEDLGTVPPYMPGILEAMRLCGTKVLRWQKNWGSGGDFIPFESYPYYSMATVSTHDTSYLFEAWNEDLTSAYLLAKSLEIPFTTDYSPFIQEHILKKIHQAESLFVINLFQEYLYLHPECQNKLPRINIPGTLNQENWTVRMPITLEKLLQEVNFMNRIKGLHL